MNSYDIWKQLSLRETQRMKHILGQAENSGAEETWISATVYSVRRYLDGVLDSLKPRMNNSDIALAESELIALVGELEVVAIK